MLNELYTFAEPVQVVPFSSLKWGKFTLLHTMNEMFVPPCSQILKNKIVCVPSVFPRFKEKSLT